MKLPPVTSIFTVALALAAFGYAGTAGAATVGVPAGDTAALAAAIEAANASVEGDVIELTAGTYELTTIADPAEGGTALPVIAGAATGGTLTINGNGATIRVQDGLDTRALLAGPGSDLTLNGLHIDGGAPGVATGTIGGTLQSLNGTLRVYGGSVTGSDAAGIANVARGSGASATLVVDAATVDGNSHGILNAAEAGGTATAIVTATTISDGDGDGLITSGEAGGTGILSATNVTVSGFDTTAAGSFAFEGHAELTLSNVTLAESFVAFGVGGGQGDAPLIRLRNVIADGQCSSGLFFEADVESTLSPGSSCAFYGATPTSSEDIALGPLADNGGPTLTHAIGPGSAALNAGDQDVCDAIVPNVDQRGSARTAAGRCDIGAFELPDADLAVTKTGPASVASGGEAEYTITVTNDINEATGVVLVDELSGGTIAFIDAPGSVTCDEGDGTLTCDLGDLAPGGEIVLVVTVTADATGGIANTASVSSPGGDSNPANNSATASTTIVADVPVPEVPAITPGAGTDPTATATPEPAGTAEPTETEPETVTATPEPTVTPEPTGEPTTTATAQPTATATVEPTTAAPTATLTRTAPMPPDTGLGTTPGGGSAMWLVLAGLATLAPGAGAMLLRRRAA